jgi:hypothetical protein
MKHLKISMIAVLAIIMGIAASAFSLKNTGVNSHADLFFYLYTSNSTAQADIQNISNYERDDLSCDDGAHVCGVYLSTDKAAGQPPVTSEFNVVKPDLWSSEQAGSATIPEIEMRN